MTSVDDAPPVSPAQLCRARVTCLLSALFIALASALLPGAMPSSQTVGSAFNPATTQVALGRDDREDAALAAPHEDDDTRPITGGGDDTQAVDSVAAVVRVTHCQRVAAQRFFIATDVPGRPALVVPGSGPRAPPVTA